MSEFLSVASGLLLFNNVFYLIKPDIRNYLFEKETKNQILLTRIFSGISILTYLSSGNKALVAFHLCGMALSVPLAFGSSKECYLPTKKLYLKYIGERMVFWNMFVANKIG